MWHHQTIRVLTKLLIRLSSTKLTSSFATGDWRINKSAQRQYCRRSRQEMSVKKQKKSNWPACIGWLLAATGWSPASAFVWFRASRGTWETGSQSIEGSGYHRIDQIDWSIGVVRGKSFTPLNAARGARAAHPFVALGRPIFALCFRFCFFCLTFFRFFFLFSVFFLFYFLLFKPDNCLELKKVQFFWKCSYIKICSNVKNIQSKKSSNVKNVQILKKCSIF
jgi:hypothetical protein